MNFDKLVNTILEGKKDEWVLFIKQDVFGDDGITTVLQLKPASLLTKEEKHIIKKEMRPAHAYMNAYEGSDVMEYDEVTVVFGSKKKLDKEAKDIKNIHDNVKMETVLEPELEPHWRGVVDEL